MIEPERLADLKKRVEQFNALQLPGQMPMMHMGTSYIINDLWRALKQLHDQARDRRGEDEDGEEFVISPDGAMERK